MTVSYQTIFSEDNSCQFRVLDIYSFIVLLFLGQVLKFYGELVHLRPLKGLK